MFASRVIADNTDERPVMFAYLALAGDLGCGFGPTIVGRVAQSLGGDLKMGILAAIVFPIILVGGVWGICKKKYIG